MERGEIRLKNETLTSLDNYVLTRGVPLPPGAVTRTDGVSIVDARGRTLPSNAKILQRRQDGSVEWMLMDILMKFSGEEEKSIYVVPKKAAKKPTVRHPVVVSRDGNETTLSNGLSEVVVSRAGGSLIRRLVINGRLLVDGSEPVDLLVVDGGGKIHRASLSGSYKVSIAHKGPLRCELKIAGTHKARDRSSFLDFAFRLSLTAGSPDLKLEHTFYCREQRSGKIDVRSMRLVMPTTMDGGARKLVRQRNHGQGGDHRSVIVRENLEVVASSLGDIDNYATSAVSATVRHPCAGGNVFIRNIESLHEDWSVYPYHMQPGGESGFRADLMTGGMRALWSVIGWQEDDFTVATTFEHFRQLHPKSIEIDENVVTWSIWPKWAAPMEIVQGVSKSHIVWLTGEPQALSVDDVIDIGDRWEYGYVEPIDVSFDPAWPIFCEVMDCQHLLTYEAGKYPLLENLVEPVPSPGNPNRHCYDRQPAIGMFHFGDLVSGDGVQCSNNEDDCHVYFPLEHFLRTGQTYAWDYGKEAARHYMEVDFCEWSTEALQKGGLIPHSGQHYNGNVYPSHQWPEGILYYYYLSGDERARNVVVNVGDNNVWWAWNRVEYLCDGREAGMPLINLAAAYRLTHDDKYIDAARHIVNEFFLKAEKKYGEFKYAYPQSSREHPQKLITGYGDWSSFTGLYRLWEQTGDESFRKLAVRMMDSAMQPGEFSVNDVRGMDFLSLWAFGIMTEDMDAAIERVAEAVPMLLRRGGHPMRRMHFLKELDERDMIDERDVGSSSADQFFSRHAD